VKRTCTPRARRPDNRNARKSVRGSQNAVRDRMSGKINIVVTSRAERTIGGDVNRGPDSERRPVDVLKFFFRRFAAVDNLRARQPAQNNEPVSVRRHRFSDKSAWRSTTTRVPVHSSRHVRLGLFVAADQQRGTPPRNGEYRNV